MKFSENWLRQWVDPQITTEELGHQLTMAGLELDGIEPAAPDLTGVIVARIDSTEPHPDADKLQVCQVNMGNNETRQIVCGAKNARAGLVTALATEGAVLPGGLKIKAAKLRGVESFGMLCASNELGLDEESAGIVELDEDLVIGQPLMQALDLNDSVLDIDLTPNRSDCLSIEGVAREVAALNSLAMNVVDMPKIAQDIEDQFEVNVQSQSDCPRYCGRILRNVDTKASTPIWMQERLRRGGVRCINFVVDVCNYVMLELGQPMHAFDLDKLSDKIIVRMAQDNEKLILLDGKEIALDSSSLIIADSNKALALAGVMGGEESAVTTNTKHLFLESAFFNPITIAGKAREYGLHTESSHRFERGVDPELATRAIQRATQLIKQFAGANVGPVSEVVNSGHLPQREPIALSVSKVSNVLGVSVSSLEVISILEDLRCAVKHVDENNILVTPPSHRFDMQIDVDLIEEVARLKGYQDFPTQRLPACESESLSQQKSDSIFAIQECLSSLGYNEAVTFSFTEEKYCGLFYEGEVKRLANPISAALSDMRTSLWPGLCEAVSYNLKRQHTSVKLFEIGRKYLLQSSELLQTEVLAGVAVGDVVPRQWGETTRAIDFYDVKGDLEHLFVSLGINQAIKFEAHDQLGLHSGKTAMILINDQPMGVVGALHPNVLKPLGLAKREVVVFELNLDGKLLDKSRSEFKLWSKYPQVRRDLTFIVNQDIMANSILEAIYALQIRELQDIVIFSVYQGEGVPENAKSVSLGLILQDFSSTLTELQIEQTMIKIISLLSDQFSADLRST